MYGALFSSSASILATVSVMTLVKRTQSKIIILHSVTNIYRRLGIRIEILCRFLLDASGRIMGQILPLVAEDEWCSSLK